MRSMVVRGAGRRRRPGSYGRDIGPEGSRRVANLCYEQTMTENERDADIDKGLAYVAAGRVKDFNADRIVARGRKLLADRSPSA